VEEIDDKLVRFSKRSSLGKILTAEATSEFAAELLMFVCVCCRECRMLLSCWWNVIALQNSVRLLGHQGCYRVTKQLNNG